MFTLATLRFNALRFSSFKQSTLSSALHPGYVPSSPDALPTSSSEPGSVSESTARQGSRLAQAALGVSLFAVSALLPLAASLPAQAQTEATAIVTALPKSGEAPTLPQQQIQVSVDGKQVQPTVWQPYGHGPVELVVLMDSSARTSIGTDLKELVDFITSLPPNVKVGVAYMQNGAATFSGPLTTDRETLARQVHLPGGSPGSDASPYFCLSDLAKRWPAPRSEARREVIMITDGVDRYSLRYDPENPYITAAIADSQRAGMVVYSIYYRGQGRISNTGYETNTGQNYLTQVADETGGNLYYEGFGNPVSFSPFFTDLNRRLMNQYELSVPVKTQKKELSVSLKVKSEVGSVKLRAPQHVTVAGEGR